MTRHSTFALTAAALLLSACAGLPAAAPDTVAPPPLPAAWQATLPHAGQATDLLRWWSQFGGAERPEDPALLQLLGAAQAASPTLASATARIAQARAARVSAGASLGPKVDAVGSASRRRSEPAAPITSVASADLQASWEIDLFGANRAGRSAAQARLEGAQAQWHDARVAVAAEAATSYTALRACEAQGLQTDVDAASRAETSRLTALSEKAGFQAPANAALARASAAQGRSAATAQRAQCDLLVKSLVALTAMEEPALRSLLAAGTARLPQPAAIAPAPLPAALLAQRPDLFNAARDVSAAAADERFTAAQQLPRVSLSGSVGGLRVSSGGANGNATTSGTTWALGPLLVTFPLYDGGARAANTEAARAVYSEAVALYQARVRLAVREVEDAFVALQSTAAQQADAAVAAEGFEVSLRATDARYKGGLASLFELEDARRTAVAAKGALIELQRERATAWVSLYRSLGGGWSAADLEQTTSVGAYVSADPNAALSPSEPKKAMP